MHAREAGIRAVVFNSRGTSGSPVLTAQFYSASFTEDMRCGCPFFCLFRLGLLPLGLDRELQSRGALWVPDCATCSHSTCGGSVPREGGPCQWYQPLHPRRRCLRCLTPSPRSPRALSARAPPSRPLSRNVVAHVRNRYPRSLLFAAGWSLGANIMTRYLGAGLGRGWGWRLGAGCLWSAGLGVEEAQREGLGSAPVRVWACIPVAAGPSAFCWEACLRR